MYVSCSLGCAPHCMQLFSTGRVYGLRSSCCGRPTPWKKQTPTEQTLHQIMKDHIMSWRPLKCCRHTGPCQPNLRSGLLNPSKPFLQLDWEAPPTDHMSGLTLSLLAAPACYNHSRKPHRHRSHEWICSLITVLLCCGARATDHIGGCAL